MKDYLAVMWVLVVWVKIPVCHHTQKCTISVDLDYLSKDNMLW